MNTPSEFAPVAPHHPAPPDKSFWQKLGGGSLSISLILHLVLLAIGVIWVFQIIPQDPAKVVDFLGKSGGGGSPASEMKVKQQRVQMAQPDLSRIVAVGATGIPLPEPVELTRMTSVGGLNSGALSGGQGGSGSGGGKGDGNGPGFGNGMAPGMSTGNGTKNPFGMIDPNQNALVGTFYNLNFKAKGDPVATDNQKQYEIIHDFTTSGWKEAELEKYQKAGQKLYQTKIFMPAMDASQAPSAFGLTPDSHPRWIVVYRGTVVAAKTGKFRFAGAGDDTLVVRFNGRNVFDFGYIPGTVPRDVRALLPGAARLPVAFRKCPMEPPVTFYQYPTTVDWNRNLGGIAVGPEVQVEAGKNYPIEILISEGWGGLFCASLMMEETGATYAKAPTGAPILPLFRTDSNLPAETKGDNIPPCDPQGPVWKVVSQRGFSDF